MSSQGKTSTFLPTGLLLAGLVAIFTGQRILLEGTPHQVANYGGLLLCAVAVGLRLRGFANASGHVRAVEGRLLAAYAGVGFALGLYALSTADGIAKLGLTGESAEHVGAALLGAWLSVMLVSLVAALFAELAYARMPIAASVELRRVSTAQQAGISLALSAVFLLTINYVATAREVRKDVSYFKTTEPSGGTRSLIEKLDQKIKVMLFFERGSDVLAQARPYFDALKGLSKNLSYEITDVALAPVIATKHKVRDNGHILLLRGTGDDQKGEVFRLGVELTEARGNLRKLDGMFQQAFTKLVRPERTLYLTVGHGERNAKGSELKDEDKVSIMQDILRRLNLKTQDIGLAQGLGKEIPAAASAVLVMGPREPFMAEEVETLLKYVRGGGRLLVLLDPDQKTGLEPLLDALGVTVLPGTVSSATNFMARLHNPSDHGIIFTNQYTAHPSVTTATRHQREVATVMVNAVALGSSTAKAEPKPRVTFPIRSAREFWRDLDGDFTKGASENSEQLNLAAASTLKVEGGTDGEQAGEKEGRAVVVGDSDFMSDKVAPNQGNYLVFVDMLAWLVGNEEINAEVSSEEDIAIEHTSQQDKIWFYATTFAVPAPIVALGLWVSRRRRRRAEVKS
jgi:hypothetical protein